MSVGMSPCRRCRTEWSCGNGSELCHECYLERVKEMTDQNQKPENPPAFPSNVDRYEPEFGMTLLDVFAKEAMGALLMTQADLVLDSKGRRQWLAENAYDIAETVLAERAKRGIR